MSMILVSILLLAIFIAMIIRHIITKCTSGNEESFITVAVVSCVILIALLIISFVSTHTIEKIKIDKFSVGKTESYILIEVNKETFKFNDAYRYNNINQNSKLVYIKHHNHWGMWKSSEDTLDIDEAK